MAKRSVVSGSVNGNPYRAHFNRDVTDEDRRFLEEVIAAVIKKYESEKPTDG